MVFLIKYIFINIWFLVCYVALVLLHFVVVYLDASIKFCFIDLDPAAVFMPVDYFLDALKSAHIL